MQNKKIDLIVGARPNFVKCTVLYDVLKKRGFTIRLIHTGQHYDEKMSDIFFKDLNIPKEDINLNVGSSSHAVQTGMIMQKYEELLYKEKCDLVIVFGDVNSTVASVITAAKLHIKTAHVEAGLRSYDRSMPEEINRLATDSISDYLFAPDMGAVNNLKKEGHTENVFLAGNIMIDTLKKHIEIIENYNLSEYNIINKKYIYMTLHRPFNVDNKDRLRFIIDFINKISEHYPIIIPLHPRTDKMLEQFDLKSNLSNSIILIESVSYLKSIAFIKNAKSVITDSGGIQEETTYLNIPCYTLRKNTERPITITNGTNMLIEPDKNALEAILSDSEKTCDAIELWDGKTSERIVDFICKEVF